MRETRAMRDEQEKRDEGEFEVRGSRFSELRTWNFELRVPPVLLVLLIPPVSLLC
jgi:hypothetical protein